MAREDDSPEREESGEDVPWLRDMLDDDLKPLFSEDEGALKKTVRAFIAEVPDDPGLERRLIDLLETALELGNDDSSASVFTAIILGEARSRRALGALGRCLASDADEMLQDAAKVALLRMGEPAIVALMEEMEEEESPALNRAGYGLLGMAGLLQDGAVEARVKDFLEGRIEAERRRPPAESAIEELFRACAQLGDRRQLGAMRKVLAEDYRGRHPGIQDACEQLEENAGGVAFVSNLAPWEERYGWLFEDEKGEKALRRPRGTGEDPWAAVAEARDEEDGAHEDGPEEDSEAEEAGRSRQSRLLWGLNAFIDDEGGEDAIDARRYLDRPDGEDEGGE
ncbi:MAG: hypothetical protein HY721_13340, partial [Planctomycetes bacterium]|nr:hypothetical protein [Planctomycetota bacterium]